MKLGDVGQLLNPAPLRLETGFERLDDGVLHVACRTDLHNCSGEMFEWWFRSRPDTRHYRWWHPVDHVSSEWVEGTTETHVGSIHLVEEFFTGLPAQRLAIQFRDATEFFDERAYDSARKERRLTAAVCGCIGLGEKPERTADGRILGGRLLHIGRDTEWGLALRSHFYIGQDLPALGKSPAEVAEIFPDEFGRALLMHCYNEFTFLSRFLPSLFLGDNRERLDIALPW
ncbi:DAPG hydrolase family protein [Paraburkholderia bannensis]|uniref:DAPG hydrolase family protein n=1 Tax=Paraburkholderia bannensis TaxID=765414 RepID=UPI002ABDD86E|nr:hydrolase [Paraburkholderia bannensis]